MNEATGCEDAAVGVEKPWSGESPVGLAFAGKGIGEGHPNFGNFAGGEETVDHLDAGAQKCDIPQPGLQCPARPFPDARALDVHADEIPVGKALCQRQRILPTAAGQLQRQRMFVAKVRSAPSADQIDGLRILPQELRTRYVEVFENIRKTEIIRKFFQFVLPHGAFYENKKPGTFIPGPNCL